MLIVECWYLNQNAQKAKAGEIRWDGKTFTVKDPSGRNLPELLTNPVQLAGGQQVYSNEDPELFMRSLHIEYHGSYFHCDPAKEV